MAAQIDELWEGGQGVAPPPFLETNRFLDAALSAPRRQIRKMRKTSFEFLGEQIEWLHPEDSAFPQELLLTFRKLLEFAELREGWNGHHGKPTEMSTIRPVLQMILAAHSRCALPRLIPLSDGGIGLRWENEEKELGIDLFGAHVEGLLVFLQDDVEVELEENATINDALRLLEKFCDTK